MNLIPYIASRKKRSGDNLECGNISLHETARHVDDWRGRQNADVTSGMNVEIPLHRNSESPKN